MVKVKVLADSISEEKVRLVTIEAEYPRVIHCELLTHRVFSRNSASSRAIPFNKMCEQLVGIPSKFGSNKPGMQDGVTMHQKCKSLSYLITAELQSVT